MTTARACCQKALRQHEKNGCTKVNRKQEKQLTEPCCCSTRVKVRTHSGLESTLQPVSISQAEEPTNRTPSYSHSGGAIHLPQMGWSLRPHIPSTVCDLAAAKL